MVLIIGPGAVGTILAAHLSAAGRAVKLYLREKDVARFAGADPLRVDPIKGAPLLAPRPEFTTSLDLAGIEYLLVCVKFPDLDKVLGQLPQQLPAELTLVSTLNGVAAVKRMRARFPAARVVCMTVMFNGQLLAPLHAQITTKPQVLIGSDDDKLLGLFGASGMEVVRAQGDASAWGKLLINLANAVCALTHSTFKDLLTRPDLRRVFAAVLDEAVDVLRRLRIPYQLLLPIPYPLYRQLILRGGPLPWWFARMKNKLQEGSYPSMVADVEQRRKTEVRQLNGEIVALGEEHRIPTPVNSKIVALIEKLETQRPPDYLTPAELRFRLGL